MIDRSDLKTKLKSALRRSPAVALLGPRQSGKTTLAREFIKTDSPNYFDLEDPEALIRLTEAKTALSSLKGLVLIDEIQRRPELFPVLRVLIDRRPSPARFLILGSASPDLLRQSSETLAGRLELIEIGGFDLKESGFASFSPLWIRGGLPPSFLASSDEESFIWRKNYIRLFLERDLAQQGIRIPSVTLHRFWTMLAHSHGQVWNASPLAASLGLSEPTIRRYLDLLTGNYMVRQLAPWHANIKKRQVKSPKIYLRDTGILHGLLGLRSEADVLRHPRSGASWEGFVIEEVLRILEPDEAYFWATHNEAEIDLILLKKDRMFGLECKRADAPGLTPSIRSALRDLPLKRITVIYPGKSAYSLNDKVSVVPVGRIAGGWSALFG